MIQFEIKKNHKGNGEFSYDLQALAASFYPEKQCVVNLRDCLLYTSRFKPGLPGHNRRREKATGGNNP